jgi:hypothetical protein
LKKQYTLVIVLLFSLFIAEFPLITSATTLSSPIVSLPNSNWEKTDSIQYPNINGEHDPAGAGMLEYTDKTNYDLVRIYYEEAQVTSYTSSQLKAEAEGLFNDIDRDDDRSLDSSGTANFAGVVAGYAKGYDSTDDTYITELVFVKDNYYFNVHAYYDATDQSENIVNSVINSINIAGAVGTSFIGSNMFYVVIVVIVVILAIVVVVLFLMRKKKSLQPQQVTQYSYPPPPPPQPSMQ